MTHRTRVAVAVLILAVGTGCGSTTSTPDSKATATSSSTSATAWAEIIDKKSGIRFQLPKSVKPEERNKAVATARNYQIKVSNDVEVSIGVVDFEVDVPDGYPRQTMEMVVSQLTRQGATDARLSKVKPVSLAKGEGLDGTVTFTSRPGPRAYWRMRAIITGHHAILVQVVSFRDAGDTTTVPLADSLFNRLTASIVID